MTDAAHPQNDSGDEPTLPILLPAAPAIPEAEVKRRSRRAKATTDMALILPSPPTTTAQPTTALATLASVFDVQPSDQPGVWLVDPRAITVDAMNARCGVPFVAEQRTDLIHSMAALGNTVPIKLRRMPEGPGFRCFSGAQRLGAALVIQQEEPAFRLRAVIHGDLTDDEAFRQGEADNAGRTDIGSMQQARHWGGKLVSVYAGDRTASAPQHQFPFRRCTRRNGVCASARLKRLEGRSRRLCSRTATVGGLALRSRPSLKMNKRPLTPSGRPKAAELLSTKVINDRASHELILASRYSLGIHAENAAHGERGLFSGERGRGRGRSRLQARRAQPSRC